MSSIIVEAPNAVVVLAENPDFVTVLGGTQGVQGIQGASGDGSAIAYPFSWGDATPAIITTSVIGKTVYKVELVLLTAFNAASSITVGDSGNNSRLFNVNNLDLSEIGTYQTNPNYTYLSSTDINLYITLGGGNTTGNGIILIYIQA